MALTTTLVSVCQDLMAETVRTTSKTANPILATTTPDVRMLSMTIAVFVYQVSEHDCTYCTALRAWLLNIILDYSRSDLRGEDLSVL